ncbi:GNAT family N-acetyltransferase [Nesterenkonia pannonica]|uniref:GNAT family N-acetyltransferase n=1 Tax=Nesterenkonia pannonica TaxID=1548602 RepID=UPI002164AD64|nr:GNAT family N-acetyltransferase [Nesterenkonia pannonica]
MRGSTPVDGAAAEDGELLALSHLSSSSRKNLRRLARKLERDEGGLEMVEESEDPEAITRFLRLQNAGWKGDAAQDGKSFERTGLDAWFRDVTDSFRADGRLSVLSLRTPAGRSSPLWCCTAACGASGSTMPTIRSSPPTAPELSVSWLSCRRCSARAGWRCSIRAWTTRSTRRPPTCIRTVCGAAPSPWGARSRTPRRPAPSYGPPSPGPAPALSG